MGISSQRATWGRKVVRTLALGVGLTVGLLGADVHPHGPNLALGKQATCSSLDDRWNPYGPDAANRAVDGKHHPDFAFHTRSEDHPWWQVDLGQAYDLGLVVIFNRRDCCQERMRKFSILASMDGANWSTLYEYDGARVWGSDGSPYRAPVFTTRNGRGIPPKARYVRIVLDGRDCLHLDQVEVYPYTPEMYSESQD